MLRQHSAEAGSTGPAPTQQGTAAPSRVLQQLLCHLKVWTKRCSKQHVLLLPAHCHTCLFLQCATAALLAAFSAMQVQWTCRHCNCVGGHCAGAFSSSLSTSNLTEDELQAEGDRLACDRVDLVPAHTAIDSLPGASIIIQIAAAPQPAAHIELLQLHVTVSRWIDIINLMIGTCPLSYAWFQKLARPSCCRLLLCCCVCPIELVELVLVEQLQIPSPCSL